jgi:hypothetical protein
MKKNVLRFAIFSAAFFLGVTIVALLYFRVIPQIPAPPLLPPPEILDCVRSKSFPGLSQKISEIERGSSGYFPKSIFSKNRNDVDRLMNDWYGKHLKAMGERSLLDDSGNDTEIYRFLWLRTFHHPVFVRVERNKNKAGLFTKELDGAGGYAPGKVLREYEHRLTKQEFCEFLNLLEKADYWSLPSTEDDGGVDGAQWILEGVKNDRYHVVDRFSPEKGEYQEACIYLLKLSNIDVDKLKDDLY